MPEAFWDAENKSVKLEDLAGKYGELSAAQKAAEERKAALPKTPSEYAFTPPEGFKLPEIDFSQPDGTVVKKRGEIDPNDPMWGKLQTLAHQEGWSQEQFSKVSALAVHYRGEMEAAHWQAVANYKAAEEAKLGDNAKARVEALHRFVDANMSADEAKAVKASIANAPMAVFLEKTITALQSAGITSFNGSGRDDGQRRDGKPQNWDAMSPVDRLTWTRTNTPQQSNGASR